MTSPREIYTSARWRTYTRLHVLLRDLYTCQRCHRRDPTAQTLVVGHQDGVANLLRWGADPFDPGECWTVCVSCVGPGEDAEAASLAA